MLRYLINNLAGNNSGGGFGILFLGLMIVTTSFVIFINIADYAMYSYKKCIISKGIDYAVSAAIQEIDLDTSREGLSYGFDPLTGKSSVDNIFLNENSADNAFFSTLQSNTGISRAGISGNLMIVWEPAELPPLTPSWCWTALTP